MKHKKLFVFLAILIIASIAIVVVSSLPKTIEPHEIHNKGRVVHSILSTLK